MSQPKAERSGEGSNGAVEMSEVSHGFDIKVDMTGIEPTKDEITSIEFTRLYTGKKEALFLATEYLFLTAGILIGAYNVFQEQDLVDFLAKETTFETTSRFIRQVKTMTILVTAILGIRLAVNLVFGLLFLLFKKGIIVEWIAIFKSKLLIDQIFIWQSPFISLPILLTALTKLIVACEAQLTEVKSSNHPETIAEMAGTAINRLFFITICYSVYMVINLVTELFVVRRQFLGNVSQSKRLGILDYSIVYFGSASLVSSFILYCFRFRYSESADYEIDLKSQVNYYYRTIVSSGAHSGIIAVFIGILGYIASLSCSKMLTLISLVFKFYSSFVFSWSCSLISSPRPIGL
ncbi:putative transmembrane Protein [Cryptosporidium felis]|nr:putative transmembrane Protein [Cryptosporidium felis]